MAKEKVTTKQKCPENISEALEAAYQIIMKGKKTNRGRISVDTITFHDPKKPSQKFRMAWISEGERYKKDPKEFCLYKGCRVTQLQ